jgi:hypothetical protein
VFFLINHGDIKSFYKLWILRKKYPHHFISK